ncbi:MAG: hypothetical protein KJ970_18915 [Candidatus Eisenbacteria bacterium]|uniref:Ig-like domain-containing protein n=1 Tax=Eiseniibacteriota bacterium TaxID=2212470 RepID=A0A948W868_UNCEI|nr:hypothetical protein [Candidatus Eisenbacteria bacterium]
MSRKFWTPVIVGSALLIALAGLWIGAVQSDLLSVEPRNNSVINYPAFPSDGGPYLVAATYWPDGGGADPELILVFNEDLNALPDENDFEATFDMTGATFAFDGGGFNNVVVVTDFDAGFVNDGTEQIRLIAPDVVKAVGGNVGNRQTTWIAFQRGPVMIDVELQAALNSNPDDDLFRVTFDHDILASTCEGDDFEDTAELSDMDGATEIDVNFNVDDRTADIDRAIGATNHFRMCRPGVTELNLAASSVRWDSDNINNSVAQRWVTTNQGPILRAAYYNDHDDVDTGNDELWITLDEPMDPNSFLDWFDDHFADDGNWGIDANSGAFNTPFIGSYSATFYITDMTFNVVGSSVPVDGDEINTAVNALDDYQGAAQTMPGNTVAINRGPGIIRAIYDDKQTSTATDDELVIYTNEELVFADLDTTDFEVVGFNFESGIDGGTYDSPEGLGRIVFRGFTTVVPVGCQIRGAADATPITGDQSGDDFDYDSWVLIEDESRPWRMEAVEDPLLTYDRWDGTAAVDSMFLGWDEAGTIDDSNQYLLWVAKGDTPASTVESVTWADNYIGNAIPVGNRTSAFLHTNQQIVILIDPDGDEPAFAPYVQRTADSQDIEEGDQLWFLLAPVDGSGNAQWVSQTGGEALIFGGFVVGPLCPPRDYISVNSFPSVADSTSWDHDVIHVVGDSIPGFGTVYTVYGDPGAVPCEADSVRIYLDHTGDVPAGAMVVNSPVDAGDESFAPVVLNPDGAPLMLGANQAQTLYIWAVNDGDLSQDPDGAGPLAGFATTRNYAGPDAAGGIPFDQEKPSLVVATAEPYDAWNPHRIYNNMDYVNIRLQASGMFDVDGDAVADATGNAILAIWADFTQIDLATGSITNFGTPADSIWFVSMGADQIDNDLDWDYVAFTDDVGLDGVAATNDPGEGDELPTFGDPFVDENGDGDWDEGETFLDVVNAESDQQGVFNPGEPNLDSQDSDEFSWYEIRSNKAGLAERGDIRQGYHVTEAITSKDLPTFVEMFNLPVVLHVEDNGVGTVFDDSPPDPTLDRSLEQFATFNGGDPTKRFILEMDDVVPTPIEWTSIELGGAGGTELLEPGDPTTYNLGRYVNLEASALSDYDVLNLQMQVYTPTGGWQPIATDFYDNGLFRDVGNDGAPGLEGYNEDAFLLPNAGTPPAGYEPQGGSPDPEGLVSALESDGVDNDEDGTIDEVGEGIDLQDPDVVDASQTSETDDGVAPLDGIHSENDYTDNDNDAFFVYDAYTGAITWYNIDERRETSVGSGVDDDLDDDNDGDTDEADEAPEGEGYDPRYDNDEDGIMGGQKVAIQVGVGTNMVLFRQPGYNGMIYVDASHVMGDRLVGGAANTAPFYANTTAYTEVAPEGFEVLTLSSRTGGTAPWTALGATAGADSTATQVFNYATLKDDDLDLGLITNLFGLTADGITEYKIRANAWDQPGNTNAASSEELVFTVDLTAPTAMIPGCGDTPTEDPPADFADVNLDTPMIEIYDAGKHPATYTLEADAESDTKIVTFAESYDGGTTWTDIGTDNDAPFTIEWPASGAMYTMNNYPAANADTVLFRALAEDAFGNMQLEVDACILTVKVIDGTNPSTALTKLTWAGGSDLDLTNGATLPQDYTVNIWVSIEDNDVVDIDPTAGITLVPLTWCGGLDMRPGDRAVNDDAAGGIDGQGVLDTNGLPDDPGEYVGTWPGTGPDGADAADEWGTAGTDDYRTNDIYKIVFEMREVPDGDWEQIDTVLGTIVTDGGEVQTVDFTQPVKVAWNTMGLDGDYDLRAWACDIEGNCNTIETQITTVTIVSEGLRAYIQYIEDMTLPYSLYAIHYIHDYEIKEVALQYYFDADGDGCWNDGNNWKTIDIIGEAVADKKGDVALYQGDGTYSVYDVAGQPVMDLTPGGGPAGWYGYVDADGDGYSSKDPVVLDADGDNLYDTGEVVAIGSPTIGDALVHFNTGDDVLDFYVDLDTSASLSPADWILRHNRLQGDNGTTDLWTTNWDPTGLADGNYLVRAVATDETGSIDDSTKACTDPSPIPVEEFTWDTIAPTVVLTEIVLPDLSTIELGTLTMTTPFVPGVNKFVKLVAEVADDDIEDVLIEYRIPPTVTWTALDWNDDDDFFSDIDGTDGFQATDGDAGTLDDELFNDLNGNFLYDGPSVDFVRSAGDNGVVDTPLGWPLLPMVSEEDPAVLADDDGDGVNNEDLSTDPEIPSAPYFVYIPLFEGGVWDLATDTNILLRATATDEMGLVGTDEVAVIFGENAGPETDVIEVFDDGGLAVDVWPTVSDGDDVDILDSSVNELEIFVTAEDVTAIDHVDLMYRLAVSNTSCYDDLTIAERLWMSASDAGMTAKDTEYPYNFVLDISGLPDGIYEFYPMGVDRNGNMTKAPANPYGFKRFLHGAEDFAFVSSPDPDEAAIEIAEGDELVIHGELLDETYEPTVMVSFYFAPRILDEVIDPALISPTWPHDAVLNDGTLTVLNPGIGEAIVLTINGVEATWVSSGTIGMYSTADYYTVIGSTVRFAARPAPTDDIIVDYNYAGSWTAIATGDSWAPYSVEWSPADGGVPYRSDLGWDDADAYDLVAIAHFDVNGDGVINSCDYSEQIASEGNYIVLKDVSRPMVTVLGLTRDTTLPNPDFNWPGNPLFESIAGNVENKLSGEETDVFILAEDVGGSGIASVDLTITAQVVGLTEQSFTVPATKITTLMDYIDIPITMYPEDYYLTYANDTRVDPAQIENVILEITQTVTKDVPMVRQYEMELQADGSYRADARFDVDMIWAYRFIIDLVGDEQVSVVDARNNFEFIPDKELNYASYLKIPATPFWYVHIENRDAATTLYQNAVHRAIATVTDNEGNVGTNLNAETIWPVAKTAGAPQGPIVFFWDPIAPEVTNLWAPSSIVGPMVDTDIYAEVHDFEGNPGIITVAQVIFEYTPNGIDWIPFGIDDDPTDGWSMPFPPAAPLVGPIPAFHAPDDDNYDNDGDGLYDEEDEATADYTIRVVVEDEALNSGFSDAQTPAVTMVVTYDGTIPMATLTAPYDGYLFQVGDLVHVAATASDDGAIHHVQFQYKDGRHVWTDTNGDGHYTSGLDEVWEETDPYTMPPVYDDGTDTPVWDGGDGSFDTADLTEGDFWFDIDQTPQDNGDDPWDMTAPYEVDWNSNEFWWTENDTYVWFGAKAVDTVMNDYRDEVLTVASDMVGASAYIAWINDETIGADEVKAVKGTISVYGPVMNPDYTAFVTLRYASAALEGEITVGIDESPFTADPPGPTPAGDSYYMIAFDTDMVPEGIYTMWAFATDQDGNEAENPLSVQIRVDRTPPVVAYDVWGGGFTNTAPYTDDGIPSNSSLAILPDEFTRDVFFYVTTTDTDVEGIYLEFRYASDPAGFWRTTGLLSGDPSLMFDYEPNLDIGANQVWRFHVEDWADMVTADDGPAQFRGRAVDGAGNDNSLQTDVMDLTIDTMTPTMWDWEDDSPTDQVESGDVVNFVISLKDASTDVFSGRLEYAVNGTSNWVIAGSIDWEGVGVDTENCLWKGEFAWTAPMVYMDTAYKFQVVVRDVVLNEADLGHPLSTTITVEDNIPPDHTKMFHVAAETYWLEDSGDGISDDPYDPNADDDIFIDLNDDGAFTLGTDYVISEGKTQGVVAGTPALYAGNDCNTWPRFYDETFLTGSDDIGTVAREVVLVARTWADDELQDVGLHHVTFLVINDATGDTTTIGRDEYKPFFPLYLWHQIWNTMELNDNGERVYPDGLYHMTAFAVDGEGNLEDIHDGNQEWFPVTVDNTEPIATMDADINMEGIQTTATVERNSVFTLFAFTETEQEDDNVYFWYKRSRDQNVTGSYRAVSGTWDADYPNNDGNPDYTRPYSMDLDLSITPDPITNEPNPDALDPLVVGESYDFVAEAGDIVCNADFYTTAYDDGRHITLTIEDTMAPIVCITSMKRNIGDTTTIENPDSVHAASIDWIKATNFASDLDLVTVDFLYRKAGTTDNWSLADADVFEVGDTYSTTWQLGEWDLQALDHNVWYEVVSVGTDDVGNSDWVEGAANPTSCDPLYIYVDYEAPEFVWYHPTEDATTICDYENVAYGNNGQRRVLDVIIEVPRVAGQPELTNDIDDVVWEWKKTGDPITSYSTSRFASDELHDDIMNTYATTFMIYDNGDGGSDVTAHLATGLYDFRSTIIDVAGNGVMGELKGLVYDKEKPTVDITNIENADPDPTQDPIDFGQTTNVTRGMSVKVFATADDDELNLPRAKETHISQIWFTVQRAGEDITHDLGTIQFDPDDWGDQTDVEAWVIWNTTGLEEGTYWLVAYALDECGNESYSSTVDVVITDMEPPTARIACLDPDLEPHGNDPKTHIWIYAVAESDPYIVDVLFQYDIVGDEPDEGWVNIGIGEEVVCPSQEDSPYTTEELWRARIESSLFADGTVLTLRALAKDEAGNRYGDVDGEPVPTLNVTVQTLADGTVVFVPVRTEPLELAIAQIRSQILTVNEATLVVTAEMANADDVPRLVMRGENSNDIYQDVPMVITMTRTIDNPLKWRAYIDTDALLCGCPSDGGSDESCFCGTISYCVSALDDDLVTDLKGETIGVYPVTEQLGSNGTVSIVAYGELGASGMVPAFSGDTGCLLLAPAERPDLNADEAQYVTPIENTTYHVQLLGASDTEGFRKGFEAVVSIYYDEADLASAEGVDLEAIDETILTVRTWDADWNITGNTLSDVTPVPEENRVWFRVSNLTLPSDKSECEECTGTNPYFTLVVPNQTAPVVVTSILPSSPYPGRQNWTDADPIFTAYLREVGGQEVDWTTVQVQIDGLTVAYVLGYDDGGSDPSGEYITWALGNGVFRLEEADQSDNLYQMVYRHSTIQEDWYDELRDPETGAYLPHKFNVRFKAVNGPDEWIELAGHGSPYEDFYVDRTPVYINFQGGFVQNPLFHNVAGYFNPLATDYQDMLTVWLYDDGSGVFFRRDRMEYLRDLNCDGVLDPADLLSETLPSPGVDWVDWWYWDYYEGGEGWCWLPTEFGLKYDLWLIDREDDQHDVDEIEERVLLHTGTPGELLPFLEPQLDQYSPREGDTLKVRLPIVGDSIIKDGDIIEVTLYSHKTIEENSDGDTYGCSVTDTLYIDGDVVLVGRDCWWDEESQEMHLYHQGILDHARNAGETFVEQRFIVDVTGPQVTFNMPLRMDPETGIALDMTLWDASAGVAVYSVSVKDANGEEMDITDPVFVNGHYTGTVEGPLPTGTYMVNLSITDRVGNTTVMTQELKVQSAILTMTEAHSYPNPFNPSEGNAQITFNLSMEAEVSVKVYDFAGDYVTTLATHELLGGTDEDVSIPWSGQAGGADLANGAYIVRITAKDPDTGRVEQTNVKIVIWRE